MQEFRPHIGKNVIETLTLGMYDDARFVFREYVQNAVDQIDEAVELEILPDRAMGKVEIDIDKENRKITITDNATGIASKNVLSFLGNVAASKKDGINRKGFRGIGRLGGLGYCERLIFETSYQGETTQSRLILDAVLLKKAIADKNVTLNASEVISFITTLNKDTTKEESHFFRIILERVTNDDLLDIDKVEPYLSMVAPIPFNKEFEFRADIYDYFTNKNVFIDEYNVLLNKKKLFKAYKGYLFDKNGERAEDINILRVSFFEIHGLNKELIALGWYYVSDKLNYQIAHNNIERGIRLRKGNIEIGSQATLGRFFSQNRQNLNYIGEVHAIGSSFVPNARRDYFNDSPTCEIFEKRLEAFFPSLGKLTNDSSRLHSGIKKIEEYKKELEVFQENINNNNLTEEQVTLKTNELRAKEKKANSAVKKIRNIEKRISNNKDLEAVYDTIIDETNIKVVPLEQVLAGKPTGSSVTELSKLTKEQKQVVTEIYKILRRDSGLTTNKAEQIIQIIAKHFN